jgi:hypothetical protein
LSGQCHPHERHFCNTVNQCEDKDGIVLAFGMKADRSGRIALIAVGCIILSDCEAVGEGMRPLPLLALADFILEITPMMIDAAVLTLHGFMAIEKQIIRFRVREAMDVMRTELMLRSAVKMDRANHHEIWHVQTKMVGKGLVCLVADAVEKHCTCGRAM